MSKICRYVECDQDCIHKKRRDDNYMCEKRKAWIWPWIVTSVEKEQLRKCRYFEVKK